MRFVKLVDSGPQAIAAALQQDSFRLMPLGEFMNKIELVHFFDIARFLEIMNEQADRRDKDAQITEDDRKFISDQITKMETHLKVVEMTHTLALTAHSNEQLKDAGIVWRELGKLVDCIRVQTHHELSTLFVGYINAERARFWSQEKPFSELVYMNFPSARADATSAGNCYAIEQYTACVFHCMRVVEKGLRALARERKIKVIKGKPLEWNDWGRIIKAIEDKANELATKLKMGPKRDKALEFYRGAAGELYGFKDTYRNYVTHDRATYDEHQAASAYHRVGEFMHRLAVHLSEDRTEAIKWLGK